MMSPGMGPFEPPARSKGTATFAIVTYVVLALSVAFVLFISNAIYTGGNNATCTDQRPDRHVGTVVAITLAGYLPLAIISLWLAKKREFEYVVFGFLLACVALFEPCGGMLWIAFSIGMC